LHPQLQKLVNKVENKTLREKLVQFLENPTIEIAGEVYTGMPLDISPAGISRHHSYPGGFVEHVAATTELALDLCNIIERIYQGVVDRDLVVSGSILHDIFKPLTYQAEANGTYRIAPLAEKLDHLTLVVSEMIRRDFPLDLIHIVCAHHGGEAGPVWPRTIEALVCHLADVTDSRLNGEVLGAARYLSRAATGAELKIVSSNEAFTVVHSKVAGVWDEVKKTVEKIRQKRQKTF
jgi:putative nucleotidyltransferase with HDIG domain